MFSKNISPSSISLIFPLIKIPHNRSCFTWPIENKMWPKLKSDSPTHEWIICHMRWTIYPTRNQTGILRGLHGGLPYWWKTTSSSYTLFYYFTGGKDSDPCESFIFHTCLESLWGRANLYKIRKNFWKKPAKDPGKQLWWSLTFVKFETVVTLVKKDPTAGEFWGTFHIFSK